MGSWLTSATRCCLGKSKIDAEDQSPPASKLKAVIFGLLQHMLRRGHVVFVIIVTEDNDSLLHLLPLRVALVVTDGVFTQEVFNKLPATCQLQAAAIGMMSQASKLALRSSCNWQVSDEEGRQHSQ